MSQDKTTRRDFDPLTGYPPCLQHPDLDCLPECECGLAGQCARDVQSDPAPSQTTEPHIDAWFDEPTMYLRWTRFGKLEQQWRVTSYSKGVTVGVDLQWREVPNA